MKLILVILIWLSSFPVIGQSVIRNNFSGTASMKKTVPPEVITNDSTSWTLSTVSTVGYIQATPGSNYGKYQAGGGMLVRFNFKENGRYLFQLYVQANSYGTSSETWTELEGTVEFTTDSKGQSILITTPEKGTYRVTNNGYTTSRAILNYELASLHSGKYLWEYTRFKDDPDHIYLLLVDLKKHPAADITQPTSIQPDWVSKFHIPVQQ